MNFSKIAASALVASVALLSTGCYKPTSIDSGEVGVVKSWGKVQDKPITAGLTFSIMPGEDLYIMAVNNKIANFSGVDKPDSETELNEAGITVLTEQQLPIPLDVSVMYQLKAELAPKMMAEFGEDIVWDNKLIVKEVRSTVRDTIGQVSLEELNKNRDTFEQKIQATLNNKLSVYGVNISNVAIRNIGIPQSIQDAVLAKETAKQNAEKAKYQVEQAHAEAEVEIAKAEGVAKANNILSGSLTDKLVQYKELDNHKIQIEKWDGKLPSTVAGANSPFLMMK